ncbi:exopolygalacturonase clone GBGA483-like [Tripterygium wilfordii]|uniref:exopolygalacturonase clone GBGA483-like n=1 Tax=Tripterygium wilfordii TaxID=458696 RepID=UPI0018F83496|nr:exopolygalacturonase clone GBGA483-like [Tripterygium wilfordii]
MKKSGFTLIVSVLVVFAAICLVGAARPAPDSPPEWDGDDSSALPPVDDPELRPRGLVFDVTHHGAVAGGRIESSSGFLAAWDAACDHGERATFYVPEGEYYVGPVEFSGPCKNNQSPKIVIRGNVIAPSKLNSFPSKSWIQFTHLNGFSIIGEHGKTNFDAQGAVEAWKQNSCQHSSHCKTLIPSLKFDNVSNGTIRNISLPSFVKIKDVTIKNVRGTYKSDSAVTLLCSPSVPCENMKLVDINLTPNHEEDDDEWREGNLNLNGAVDGLQVINSNF